MRRLAFLLFILLPVVIFISSCSLPTVSPSGTAYIYGVTQYDILNDLQYTDDDARDMADLFEAAGYEVRLRIDDGSEDGTEPATVDQLAADIAEFAAEAAPGELFIFYYAGHGGRYDELYDLSTAPEGLPPPPDAEEPAAGVGGDEWIFLYGSIPGWSYETWTNAALKDDDLADMLLEIPGNMKLVIIDACKSGGFIGDSPFVDPIPPDYEESESTATPSPGSMRTSFGFSEDSALDIAEGNAFVLTAAGELEDSIETAGNGVFTAAFLEAAAEGDINSDGYITLMEIYRYIADSWTDRPLTDTFHPHITGSAVDLVLFAP